MNITIAANGVPRSAQAIEGPEELRAAATSYVLRWRFEPVQANGKAVEARFRLSMPFKLRGKQSEASPSGPGEPGNTVASDGRTEPVRVEWDLVQVAHQPPAPHYPKEAREKRIEGVVVVAITIGKDGIPRTAQAISGPQELRAVAAEYARAWRFKPTIIKGEVVEAKFVLNMPFNLR